jgi:hypothetical protein
MGGINVVLSTVAFKADDEELDKRAAAGAKATAEGSTHVARKREKENFMMDGWMDKRKERLGKLIRLSTTTVGVESLS